MPAPRERLSSVDLLRGLVMVVMALDHVRDFFSDALDVAITDPRTTTVPLFLTRWVTHYCAPTFVLLAGVGAALSEQRGLSKPSLAKFLFIRGLWLVLLELTLVRHGFYFTTSTTHYEGLVIWVLGWCMVLLAALQFLPRPALLAFSLLLICGHNLTDGWKAENFGGFSWLWKILHGGGPIVISDHLQIATPYRIVPWIGVMTLGYCLGPVFQWPRPQRRQFLLVLGLSSITLFIVFRGLNVYGDPNPWVWHPHWLNEIRSVEHELAPRTQYLMKTMSWQRSAMSFLNCEKYPPSLCYLLMTLGPAFVALALFDREPGWLGRRLVVLGRVPLFYYLLHLPLIHGAACIASIIHNRGVIDDWLISAPGTEFHRVGYGYSLPVVYAVWIGVVLALYPLCAWFANQKRRHPGGWRSFL